MSRSPLLPEKRKKSIDRKMLNIQEPIFYRTPVKPNYKPRLDLFKNRKENYRTGKSIVTPEKYSGRIIRKRSPIPDVKSKSSRTIHRTKETLRLLRGQTPVKAVPI